MTTAVTDPSTTGSAGLTGRVSRVLGAVVDVEFPRGAVPALFNALTTEITLEAVAKTVTFEVAQHLGDNMVRCISMQSTDGLVRGAEVVDTGNPISVPVGDVVKASLQQKIEEYKELNEMVSLEYYENWKAAQAER